MVVCRAAKIELYQQSLRGKHVGDDDDDTVDNGVHGNDDDDDDEDHRELSYASTGGGARPSYSSPAILPTNSLYVPAHYYQLTHHMYWLTILPAN